MTVIKKPLNYLNNKDILKEIHLSKNTYCSFTEPQDHQYDYIIDYEEGVILEDSLKIALKPEVIQKAKENRAYRLGIESGTKIDPTTIEHCDLVFRVMTWDHIPLAPKQSRKVDKKKSARELFDFEFEDEPLFDDLDDPKLNKEMGMSDMSHVRVNFPPFQHFKYAVAGNQMYCVGKSHWKGDIYTGYFDKDKGQITNKLAKMYLMLCEKYAMRFNWRGYTYNDEMRGAAILQLTYVGLRFNEAKSSNPFAYYTAAITNSFCRVLNTEKKNQGIRDDILEANGLNPSWSRQFAEES